MRSVVKKLTLGFVSRTENDCANDVHQCFALNILPLHHHSRCSLARSKITAIPAEAPLLNPSPRPHLTIPPPYPIFPRK